jgi:signal transduction histidine kinase/CheY-like chemotaxis protein
VDDEPTNILVVDDLPEQLLVYRTILDELGQNLVTAGSGEDALRAVLNHDFAVILLDVNMPRMSGLETAAMIRRRKRSAHTPIIFVTAFADEVRAAEGYAQGAVDYITTPIVPAVLRAKVRVFADLYRMNQQVRRQAEQRIALAEERTRREAAEDANRRLAFLVRTGAVVGQSLDQDVTAQDAVRLPVPAVADVAVLVTFHPDGRSGKIFWSRPGPDEPVVESLAGWPSPEFPYPALVAEVERVIAGHPPGEPGAAVAYPLQARGRVFAVLGLSRETSARGFPPDDRTVAEAFASRCAVALENAQLYHELRQADRQKNEFLSMLAHELRNPLAPIRSANEVLRERGEEPERVRWAQGVIDRQLGHMVRLVDDLLDISRLTLGKIRLVIEPVDLGTVVAQAVEAVRPLIDRSRHRLDVILPPVPVRLMGDKARLTQILTNMLNNATKYTDPGGRVSLTAEVGVRGTELAADTAGSGLHLALGSPRAPFVAIRVRDTGIGIAPELLPTVFDLFTQASRSLDRSQGGLGVGLALVRRLVELHGGTVRAHSDGPGKGSEFVVELPVAADEPQPVAEQPPAPASQQERSSLRVVVVDDNVDGAESLATLLGLMGHEVRVAHDGPGGIAAVREFGPDLVLLDIGLPGMDGYEVARRLRREPGVGAVLAAVSGYGRDDDRRMAREAGFAHHFVKPVDLSDLRRLLDSVTAARRA